MKKICIISHSFPHFKGDWRANFVESLAEAYAKEAKVTVFTPYVTSWNRPTRVSDNLEVVLFRYAPFRRLHTLGLDPIMKGDLKLNLINYFIAPLMLISGVIQFARLLRHSEFDMVQAHWAVPNTIIAILGKFLARSNVKVFTSFPGSDVTLLSSFGWVGRILAKIIGASDYLSCNSSDLKEDLVKVGLRPESIDLVIYGVDPNRMRFDAQKRHLVRKEYAIADDETLLLMVGRFVPKKGFSVGLRAMKPIVSRHPKVKLMIVGDGALKDEYDAIIQQDGIASHVIFTGKLPLDKLDGVYSACDLLLMPSQRDPSDGLNVVVPEAMSCGRPVVASNVGGNELVVFPGRNGYLHPEKDYRALADHVIRIISQPNEMQRMGENSLQLIQERFNWDAIARHYLSQYSKIKG